MCRNLMVFLIAVPFLLSIGPAGAAPPNKLHYEAKPYLVTTPYIPQVLLILAKDHKMFYQAYNNLVDLNGDGKIDIGFNPSVVYLGYFDPYSCYEYASESTSVRYFQRTRTADPETSDPARPAILRKSVEAPRSATGICPKTRSSERSGTDGEWSGNWLNYATTSRMDAIRKVLYGGKRVTDTASQTILQNSFIPYDSHVFGVEVVADNLWNTYVPHSPYYNISNFTPYWKPKDDRMIFFARVSNINLSTTSPPREMPLLRVVANIDSEHTIVYFKSKVRLWDWALGEYPVPNYSVLPSASTSGRWDTDYYMQVAACAAVNGSVSATEGCRLYSNGSYKPAGLLQEYGESNTMYFGLMTGSINDSYRNKGGMLRHHVGSINQAINKSTGQVISKGLVDTIDQLRLTGWTYGQSRYQNSTSWGNPLGEMLYEGVRYFAQLEEPIFYTNSENSIPVVGSTGTVTINKIGKWKDSSAPNWADYKCAKPIIMLISDVFPESDSDDIPSSSDLKRSPLAKLSSSDFPNFTLNHYLKQITTNEGMKGKTYFFSKSNDYTDPNKPGDCAAKILTDLSEVDGLCPSEPAKKGSYSLAAVAYYAQTHDFTGRNTPIDIYSVAMSSSFPELAFEVPTKGKISIQPASVSQVNSNRTDSRPNVYGFINYFITDWHTDTNEMPFKVTAIANFEDEFEGSDFERDGLATYEIGLITSKSRVRDLSKLDTTVNNGNGIYIHSGPFNTPTKGQIYYMFKNDWDPNAPAGVDKKITIEPDEVLGLAIYTTSIGSTTGASMSLGYTINGTGTTYNGTYVDTDGTYLVVGHHRSNINRNLGDWPHTPYSGRTNATGMPSGYNNAPNLTSKLNTPWNCPYSGSTDSACGKVLPHEQTRSFEFASVASAVSAEHLPNPMFLAAKYGKFMSRNTGDGVPAKGQWDTRETGVPDTYFEVKNMNDLSAQLGQAFSDISKSVATGTATAASINSVLGGGVSVQAMYYPEYPSPADRKDAGDSFITTWAGNVYGLFVDKWGNLREDTNRNGFLDLATGESGELGDLIVEIVSQTSGDPTIYRWTDPKGTNVWVTRKEVENRSELNYVWNTAKWLAERESDSTLLRNSYNSKGGRMIFTFFGDPPKTNNKWDMAQPLNNFLFNTDNAGSLQELMVHGTTLGLPKAFSGSSGGNYFHITGTGPLPAGMKTLKVQIKINQSASGITTAASGDTLTVVINRGAAAGEATAANVVAAINDYWYDFDKGIPLIRATLRPGDAGEWAVAAASATEIPRKASDTARALIDYVSGVEQSGWRSRLVKAPSGWSGKEVCTEGGSADCLVWRLGDVINSKPIIVGGAASNYDLIYGDRSYSAFKYNPSVAQRRQMVYFGSNSGMLHAVNLGFYGDLATGQAGYKAKLTELGHPLLGAPDHQLGAEVWAFVPKAVLPHLQWLPDPNYDHSYYVDLKPQVADVKNNTGARRPMGGTKVWEQGEWRTILVGGLRLGGNTIEMPTGTDPKYSHSEFFALDITDPETPPVLLWRFGDKNLGLTTAQPTVVSNNGRWYVVLASGPTNYDHAADGPPVNPVKGVPYGGTSTQKARIIVLDAVTGEICASPDPGHGALNSKLEVPEEMSFFGDSFIPIVSGKALKTLVTRDNVSGETVWTNPVVYYGLTQNRDASSLDKGAMYRLVMVKEDGLTAEPDPKKWELVKMFDAERPITGSANSTYDSTGNLWVVFGTGRMWDEQDVYPCRGASGAALAACEENHIQKLFGLKEPVNSSGVVTYRDAVPKTGIMDVSAVKVFEDGSISGSGSYSRYSSLRQAIASVSYGGYARKLESNKIFNSNGTFELCAYQPKIEGLGSGASLTTFTTYELSTDECEPEGQSYLYLVDTFTGLPYPEMGLYNMTLEGIKTESNADGSARIYGAIKAGRGRATEAWIVKTDTGIRVGATGQDTSIYSVDIAADQSQVSSVISWREVLDMGFSMKEEDYIKGIDMLKKEGTGTP